MPQYTSPESGVEFYDIDIDSELVSQFRRLNRLATVGSRRATIPADIDDLSGLILSLFPAHSAILSAIDELIELNFGGSINSNLTTHSQKIDRAYADTSAAIFFGLRNLSLTELRRDEDVPDRIRDILDDTQDYRKAVRSFRNYTRRVLRDITRIRQQGGYFDSLIYGNAIGIRVDFRDGHSAHYPDSTIGSSTLDKMIELGEANRGLQTFINRHFRGRGDLGEDERKSRQRRIEIFLRGINTNRRR